MTSPLRKKADRTFDSLSLRFTDPVLEQRYIQEYNRRAVGPLRLLIILVLVATVIPALVELFGFTQEGWTGFEYWLGVLPYRAAVFVFLLVALWLIRQDWAIKRGQPLVAIALAVLSLPLLIAADIGGPWIERTATFANYGITLVLVAVGLIFRFAVPIASLLVLAFTPVVVKWMDNPFAPLFVTYATLITLSWVAYSIERARREAWAGTLDLADEKALSERLLLNVLPPSIARRMQSGETVIADSHPEATVVFADIVNFTPLSASVSPESLVEILDDIFAAFDLIAEKYDLEKIKTIGDAYMMAAGLPTERSRDPGRALDAILEMRDSLAVISARREIDVSMRAGVHIGPVVAGVIGRSKFVYDLWGDSVNVASRMESTAPAGAVQVTEEVHQRLGEDFVLTPRGEIDVKGKGKMRTWLLEKRRDSTA